LALQLRVARSSLVCTSMTNAARISVIGFLAVIAAAPCGAAALDGRHGWHPEFEAARQEIFDPVPDVEHDEAPATAQQAAPAQPAHAPACGLWTIGSDAMTAQGCLQCHSGTNGPAIRSTHFVGPYRFGPGLRTVEEVVKRGVLVPRGNIECVTCHDRRSPWKNHLALPPGAPALPAVRAGDPSTYTNRPNWRTARPNALMLQQGTAVSPAPLCAACHTTAD
jgi:hypothetical protein